MRRILLRIRPEETMDDLDLELIQKRALFPEDWNAQILDSRLSDAPYISIIISLPGITADEVARLKEAFGGMPRMKVYLWMDRRREMAIDLVDKKALDEAAISFEEVA